MKPLAFVLADVSEGPLQLCRERFAEQDRIAYVLSSGGDLPGVSDQLAGPLQEPDVKRGLGTG